MHISRWALAVTLAALAGEARSQTPPPPPPRPKPLHITPLAIKPPPAPHFNAPAIPVFRPMPAAPIPAPMPVKTAPPPSTATPIPAPLAKAAAPKPQLSAPAPTLKTARSETLARLNALEDAAAASKNPSVTRALGAVKNQQLDWPTPAKPVPNELAANLATAMGVGDKTQKLLPQLAALNDALAGTQTQGRQAGLALLKAAGKPVPKTPELDKMLAAAGTARQAALPDSQHGMMNAGKNQIAIDSSPATGRTQLSVYQPGADGKPERVTLQAADATSINALGSALQVLPQVQPPQIISTAQSDAMRVRANGSWIDQDGHFWEISGQGNAITFTESRPDGHKMGYGGQWMMGLPYASHLVNDVADMDDTLPDDVKQQLADSYHPPFAVKLEYSPDKDTFTGVWTSGEVTYSGMFHTVKVVNDPTWDKLLVLTRSLRPMYHIVSVHADYSPWEAAMRRNSSEERVTQMELDDRKHQLDAAISLYNAKLAAIRTEQTKLLGLRAAADRAEQAAGNAALDPGDETHQYKQAQADLDRLNRQLAAVNGVISNTNAIGGIVPGATFDRRDALQRQIDAQNAKLQTMANGLGLSAKHAALDKAANDAAEARRREEVNYVAVVAAAEAAKKGQEEAADLYLQALRAHDDADAAVHALEAKGVPLITYVNLAEGSQSYYRAQWWNPKQLLDFLDGEIPALEKIMLDAADDRISARGALLSLQQQSTIDLDRLHSAILKSAAAQATIEAGFYFYDVVEKAREGGPFAAMYEATKKLIEAAVLGPPTFYNPSLRPARLW